MSRASSLSAAEARRIALAAQGFTARPASAGKSRLLKTIDRLGVIQIDSVNVLVRSHYLPLFSRLGPYARDQLETLAWAKTRPLFEYWAHEASLLPLDMHPLLRWRMDDARQGVGVWRNVAKFLNERRDLIDRALGEIRDRGPLSAADLELGEKGAGGWWGWSDAKRALECLFWAGEVTTATRRSAFERVYGLPEQVLPTAVVQASTPSRAQAQRALILRAAQAMGVATEADLRDYYRLTPGEARTRVAELVEAGELAPVAVEGWSRPAYLAQDASVPASVRASALLSPFDNLIWFRERAERLFDVRIRLEIYTPAHKRVHGYYVLPFLEAGAITARVDLKLDRQAAVLRVKAAHRERRAGAATAERLAQELRAMAAWLGVAEVAVEAAGDLAEPLDAVLRTAGATGR